MTISLSRVRCDRRAIEDHDMIRNTRPRRRRRRRDFQLSSKGEPGFMILSVLMSLLVENSGWTMISLGVSRTIGIGIG